MDRQRGLLSLLSIVFSLTLTTTAAASPCGNGVVEGDEECDDGGVCIGGSNAGTACVAESDCHGNGVCVDGSKTLTGCASDVDCPGGACRRCKTFGGDGCAANCTTETTIPYNLVQGVVQGQGIKAGTSGAVINSEAFTIPLPLTGTQNVVIGKERGGKIPAVIPAASVQFPKIPVQTIACTCLRAADYKTCGGTIFDPDGVTQSPGCTPNFATSPVDCAAIGKNPCASVFGAGNAGAGVIGCQGLSPVDVDVTQDCNGTEGEMPFPPALQLSGTGGPGSATVVTTLGLGVFVGSCAAAPLSFCTDAEPAAARGNPLPLVSTTGKATGAVYNANDFPGFDIGPFSTQGSAFSCASLTASPPTVTGASLAASFTACDQQTVRDIVVTSAFVAQPGPPPPTPPPTPGGPAPAPCTAGNDPGSGQPWVVCQADTKTAWVSINSGGFGAYHPLPICQQLGYSSFGSFGGNCGAVCGYCEGGTNCSTPGNRFFDGSGNCGTDGMGQILCNTVQWECTGFVGTPAATPTATRTATPTNTPTATPPHEDSGAAAGCSDGIDNDGDGLTDCADPDCGNTPPCGVVAPLLSSTMMAALIATLSAVGLLGLRGVRVRLPLGPNLAL